MTGDLGPRRALAIAAHPDDIEFGAGGTVAGWVDEGWDVRYVIATSGDKGVQDPGADLAAIAVVREQESRAAAAVCGVTDVTFLGLPDTEVVLDVALRRVLSRQFRRHRPHRLLVMDPDPVLGPDFVNHPDHRAVGQGALDITVTGGTTGAIFPELVLEEGLEPWRGLEEIWIMGPAGGPVAVDVSSTIDRKLEALSAHASQLAGWDFEAAVRRALERMGAEQGYPYAEAFRVLHVAGP